MRNQLAYVLRRSKFAKQQQAYLAQTANMFKPAEHLQPVDCLLNY